MLKNYLKEKGIAYTEKFVDQDDAARNEMMAESGGFLGVPYSVIKREDGTKEDVIGFDKGKLDEILNPA